jgi:hypothetical protein
MNSTTQSDAYETPAWQPILLTAMAGGMGWGIRGQYGHENGAMIAGALVTLTISVLLARKMPIDHLVRAIALGIIGMGLGGSMSYGETVGLTHDRNLHVDMVNWPAFRWGMLGLAIKGGIWIGFFGLLLGMGLSGKRYTLRIMVALLFAALGAYYLGINSINYPFNPFPLDSPDRALPYLYFSDHWDWEPISQIKPRYENWGGMLLALILVFVYAGWWMKDGLARNMALWGFLAGGLGFPGGQCVQAYHQLVEGSFSSGIWPHLSVNWWNAMETSFGLIMGSIVGLGFWMNRKRIGASLSPDAGDTERAYIPIPAEFLLVTLHVTLLGCLEFYFIKNVDVLYDLGLVMALIPIVLIFGGRLGPYMVIFPFILQTIAGKNVRDIVYKQIHHEDGTKERIYNEAAQIHLPFFSENLPLPFGIGWSIYFVIPMGIALGSVLFFYVKHRHVEKDPLFPGYALLIMGWLFFYLNWAFFGYPWPWEGWGDWPWQKWGGPSTTGTFFLICMTSLTFLVYRVRRKEIGAAAEGGDGQN